MAVQTILPNQNLTWDDIRDTLNANGGSVTNDVSTAFKSTANIDIWSKNKPVILNSLEPDRNSEWWKSTNGNCGIVPYRITSYYNLPDLYDNWTNDKLNGWRYELPTGGANEPFRIGDFAGYYADALPPFIRFTMPATVAINQSKFQSSAMIPISSEGQLVLSDLSSIKSCYFGVYIVKSGNTSGQRATSNSVDNPSVEFSTNGFTAGTYTAYPFLSSVKYTQLEVDKAGDYFSVPELKPVTFQMVSTLTSISVKANVNSDNTSISYTIDVINSAGTLTLRNNYVSLRYYDKEYLDPMVVGERQEKLDDYNVGNGTTTIASGTFYNVPSDLINNCKIWVSLSSAKYLQFVVPMRPLPIT